jgi:hypothetical protein
VKHAPCRSIRSRETISRPRGEPRCRFDAARAALRNADRSGLQSRHRLPRELPRPRAEISPGGSPSCWRTTVPGHRLRQSMTEVEEAVRQVSRDRDAAFPECPRLGKFEKLGARPGERSSRPSNVGHGVIIEHRARSRAGTSAPTHKLVRLVEKVSTFEALIGSVAIERRVRSGALRRSLNITDQTFDADILAFPSSV